MSTPSKSNEEALPSSIQSAAPSSFLEYVLSKDPLAPIKDLQKAGVEGRELARLEKGKAADRFVLERMYQADKTAPDGPEPVKKEVDPATLNREFRGKAQQSDYQWEVGDIDRKFGHAPVASREGEVFERSYAYKAPSKEGAPVLLVTAGVHGNEGAGPKASLELLNLPEFKDLGVLVIPTLNPIGLKNGHRSNDLGVDLNRTALGSSHEMYNAFEFLRKFKDEKKIQFSAAIDLHEDWWPHKDPKKGNRVIQGPYFYVSTLDPKGWEKNGIATHLTSSLKKALDPLGRNTLPEIDGLKTDHGVIKRSGLESEAPPSAAEKAKSAAITPEEHWNNALSDNHKRAFTAGLRQLIGVPLVVVLESPSHVSDVSKRINIGITAVKTVSSMINESGPILSPALNGTERGQVFHEKEGIFLNFQRADKIPRSLRGTKPRSNAIR